MERVSEGRRIFPAYMEWCPKKAVRHWGKTVGQDYHHPGVKVSDMFR